MSQVRTRCNDTVCFVAGLVTCTSMSLHWLITGEALFTQDAKSQRSGFEQRFGHYRYFVASAARIGDNNLTLTNCHEDRLACSLLVPCVQIDTSQSAPANSPGRCYATG